METEKKSEPEEISKYKRIIPIDLVSLYMDNLQAMSDAKDSHEYYRRLMQSISIGRALLTDKHSNLRKKADEILKNSKSYPETRQMEFSGSTYRLGSSMTGTIEVRADEMKIGQDEAINQQCDRMTPKLKSLDNDIFDAIVGENVIIKKKKSMEDIVKEKYLKKIKGDS